MGANEGRLSAVAAWIAWFRRKTPYWSILTEVEQLANKAVVLKATSKDMLGIVIGTARKKETERGCLVIFGVQSLLPILTLRNIFQTSLKYICKEVNMRFAKAPAQPLDFLKLLAHNIRWQILLLLARSDHKVEELVNQIKQPHNLISYHLKRLRLKQLVSERRSTADGRDIYYSLNLDYFRQMYSKTGASLHPALSNPYTQTETSRSSPARVLFLCTHNSARSQMAEGLLRKIGGDKVQVFSAGSEPTDIHPLAVKAMRSRGIDLNLQRSKHMEEFVGQNFDSVITVCDRVREVCPVFPGDPEKTHWSFPDPAAIEGDWQTREKGFEDTARELTLRIQYLLLMIDRKIR